ncbi:hypothetical protein CW304_15845 [Bacillus sp. UFRGS-B20]|nr:hypothetical protein CW304_15845 [Bacillus sp. UFRGS-B20]
MILIRNNDWIIAPNSFISIAFQSFPVLLPLSNPNLPIPLLLLTTFMLIQCTYVQETLLQTLCLLSINTA